MSTLPAPSQGPRFPGPLPAPGDALRSWTDLVDGFASEWLRTPTGEKVAVRVMQERAPLSKGMHAEAKRLLAKYERACTGPAPQFMEGWLRFIAMSVRNPPDPDALPEVAGAYAFMMADLPNACFTDECLRAGAQVWEFWPSVAEIAKLVRDDAERLTQRLRVLRFIAALPAPAA